MKVALLGDTMLGRLVADRLAATPRAQLFSGEVVAIIHEADLTVMNLECAVSDRGEPWPDRFKRFWFRAPPVAIETLTQLGVSCVTLANNHAMDFGTVALLDTLDLLDAAGIAVIGAGPTEVASRRPAVLDRAGMRIAIAGFADHPADFAAGPNEPGIAYANLRRGVPGWLTETVATVEADIVLVTPHWGPNMVTEPVPHVRRAAAALLEAGATLIAGHSAHVFHGVADGVLFDLGDLIDDYAVDPRLRNNLTLLFLVTFEGARPTRVEAVPLAIDHCHTRLADAREAAWITRRFRRACGDLGTEVAEHAGRLVVEWGSSAA